MRGGGETPEGHNVASDGVERNDAIVRRARARTMPDVTGETPTPRWVAAFDSLDDGQPRQRPAMATTATVRSVRSATAGAARAAAARPGT